MHPADVSRLCKGDGSSAESKAPEDTAATTWRHRSSVSAHAVGAMVLLLLLGVLMLVEVYVPVVLCWEGAHSLEEVDFGIVALLGGGVCACTLG